MLQVLTPAQVVESREDLLNEIEDALLGDPDDWKNGFPGNFELYNMLHHIYKFWERGGR